MYCLGNHLTALLIFPQNRQKILLTWRILTWGIHSTTCRMKATSHNTWMCLCFLQVLTNVKRSSWLPLSSEVNHNIPIFISPHPKLSRTNDHTTTPRMMDQVAPSQCNFFNLLHIVAGYRYPTGKWLASVFLFRSTSFSCFLIRLLILELRQFGARLSVFDVCKLMGLWYVAEWLVWEQLGVFMCLMAMILVGWYCELLLLDAWFSHKFHSFPSTITWLFAKTKFLDLYFYVLFQFECFRVE